MAAGMRGVVTSLHLRMPSLLSALPFFREAGREEGGVFLRICFSGWSRFCFSSLSFLFISRCISAGLPMYWYCKCEMSRLSSIGASIAMRRYLGRKNCFRLT